MTTARVVETSVTVTNSSFLNCTHPDGHTRQDSRTSDYRDINSLLFFTYFGFDILPVLAAPTFSDPNTLKRAFIAWPASHTIRLKCKAKGAPPLKYAWLKDGHRMPQRRMGSNLNSSIWYLILKDLVPNDSGKYTCIVANPYGSINHTYTLNVVGKYSHGNYRKWSNKRPLSNKRLVSIKRPPQRCKLCIRRFPLINAPCLNRPSYARKGNLVKRDRSSCKYNSPYWMSPTSQTLYRSLLTRTSKRRTMPTWLTQMAMKTSISNYERNL